MTIATKLLKLSAWLMNKLDWTHEWVVLYRCRFCDRWFDEEELLAHYHRLHLQCSTQE